MVNKKIWSFYSAKKFEKKTNPEEYASHFLMLILWTLNNTVAESVHAQNLLSENRTGRQDI